MRDKTDALMRVLYEAAKGEMHQTLVANFSIADAYRSVQARSQLPHRRFLLCVTTTAWRTTSAILGWKFGFYLSAAFVCALSLPRVVREALRLHPGSYHWQGEPEAKIILLRTMVSNEPKIAKWLEERHGAPIAMLQRDLVAPLHLSCLWRAAGLAKDYFRLNFCTANTLIRLSETKCLKEVFSDLAPYWLALMGREGVNIVWARSWAKIHLTPRRPNHFYFTMNSVMEDGFRFALSDVPSAYVEHGFPRRDIPPLECKQYLYSEGYADYLRGFEAGLEAEIIGHSYFPKATIEPTRTIVIATLQDWAGFKIADVETVFNRALQEARSRKWRIVFRTRIYGTDAFAKALKGPWDEISEASQEPFETCLSRTRPTMVWTTWSTAVLDATACGVEAYAFVTPQLDDFYVTDLDNFALRVMPDGTGYDQLSLRLNRGI